MCSVLSFCHQYYGNPVRRIRFRKPVLETFLLICPDKLPHDTRFRPLPRDTLDEEDRIEEDDPRLCFKLFRFVAGLKLVSVSVLKVALEFDCSQSPE